MKSKTDKSKERQPKAQVKIRDIKPRKDAKGGRTADPCEGGEVTSGWLGKK